MTSITLIKQWHPALVHFPIALLTLEALFIVLYLRNKKPEYELFAYWLLSLATLSMIPVVLSGLNDSGLDMGPGIPILLGLEDRIKNAFRFESTISLHAALALPVVLLTIGRWICRRRSRSAANNATTGATNLIFALITLILMYVAAYIGGTVSHG